MDPTAQLRAAAIRLARVDPVLPEDGLAPLQERLVGPRLIGLGEAAHGDHESFAFYFRLIQALVRRGRCGAVIFERGVAEMDARGRYVTGATDARSLVDDLFPQRTEEVSGLFQCVRAWNRGGGCVRLAGMDMPSRTGLRLALALLNQEGGAVPDACGPALPHALNPAHPWTAWRCPR